MFRMRVRMRNLWADGIGSLALAADLSDKRMPHAGARKMLIALGQVKRESLPRHAPITFA